MSETVKGSCLCGAVKLEIREFRDVVTYCHCTQCRKQSGHYYAAVNVLNENLTLSGDEAVRWYAASGIAKRGFCGTCGSVLFWKPNDANYLSVMAGCLDSPTGLVADGHIFVADKGDYYTLDDGLPQYPQSD